MSGQLWEELHSQLKTSEASTLPEIVGRAKELEQIRSFVARALAKQRRASVLIVGGSPGTGKTAVVSQVHHGLMAWAATKQCETGESDAAAWKGVKRLKTTCTVFAPRPVRSLYVNALSLEGSERETLDHILSKLATPADEMVKGQSSKETLALLFAQEVCVLIIDEMDLLNAKAKEALARWAIAEDSRLVLVGVSNSAQVVDVPSQHIEGMIFSPYKHEELVDIVKHKLLKEFYEGKVEFAEDALRTGLELSARGVAKRSGDFREAMDMLRRAAIIARSEQSVNASDKVVVTFQHIIKSKRAGESSCVSTGDWLSGMTNQSKYVLAAMVRALTVSPSADPKRKGQVLFDQIDKCFKEMKRDWSIPTEWSSFDEAWSALESAGMVARTGKKKAGVKGLTPKPDKNTWVQLEGKSVEDILAAFQKEQSSAVVPTSDVENQQQIGAGSKRERPVVQFMRGAEPPRGPLAVVNMYRPTNIA